MFLSPIVDKQWGQKVSGHGSWQILKNPSCPTRPESPEQLELLRNKPWNKSFGGSKPRSHLSKVLVYVIVPKIVLNIPRNTQIYCTNTSDVCFFPQQQNALGSSAIVKASEQTGAAPKPIPPRFPGSQVKVPRFPSKGSQVKVPN